MVQTHSRIRNPVEKTSNSPNSANIMAGEKLHSWQHPQIHTLVWVTVNTNACLFQNMNLNIHCHQQTSFKLYHTKKWNPHTTSCKNNPKTAYLRLTLWYTKCGRYVNFAHFHDSRTAFVQNIPIIFYFDSINRLLQNYKQMIILSTHTLSSFSGLEVACWLSVPKFGGSHLAEAVGFLGWKILSMPSFGGEAKPSVPCRSFTACKRSLNVTWKPAFRQNYRTFLGHSSTFRRWVLSRGDRRGDAWWLKVGTSNPDRTISLEGCSA